MCKTQHLVCVVPAGFDITRYHTTGQRSLISLLACRCHAFKNGKPLRKNLGCGPLDCIHRLSELSEKKKKNLLIIMSHQTLTRTRGGLHGVVVTSAALATCTPRQAPAPRHGPASSTPTRRSYFYEYRKNLSSTTTDYVYKFPRFHLLPRKLSNHILRLHLD